MKLEFMIGRRNAVSYVCVSRIQTSWESCGLAQTGSERVLLSWVSNFSPALVFFTLRNTDGNLLLFSAACLRGIEIAQKCKIWEYLLYTLSCGKAWTLEMEKLEIEPRLPPQT